MDIYFLLIDDELAYCKSFKDNAELVHGISVSFFHNHQDGFEELYAHPHKYKAIVLDAKCLKNAQQTVETDDALGYALELLSKFEKQTNIYLPFVVNTGYDMFEPFFRAMVQERGGKLFSKLNKDPEELFTYLMDKVNNSENTQIERSYAEVFEIFELGLLNENNTKNDLLTILKQIDNKDSAVIKQTLGLIRTISERACLKIQTKKPFLINHFIRTTTDIPSNYGNHTINKDCQPSYLAVRAVAYALLELLIWVKNELKNTTS